MSEENKGNGIFWALLLLIGGGSVWAINKFIVSPKMPTPKTKKGGSKKNDTVSNVDNQTNNNNSGTQIINNTVNTPSSNSTTVTANNTITTTSTPQHHYNYPDRPSDNEISQIDINNANTYELQLMQPSRIDFLYPDGSKNSSHTSNDFAKTNYYMIYISNNGKVSAFPPYHNTPIYFGDIYGSYWIPAFNNVLEAIRADTSPTIFTTAPIGDTYYDNLKGKKIDIFTNKVIS
jgi:hypothetical protein